MKIAKEDFEHFKDWVDREYNYKVSPNTNNWEVVRWKIPNEPMAISYVNSKDDLIKLNKSCEKLWREYLFYDC